MQSLGRKTIFSMHGNIFPCIFQICHCTIHAFCIMSNHYHLLIETPDIEIWKFVKNLSHSYAMFYNQKHSFVGHLFEGRYKSCLVEEDIDDL